MNDEITLYEPDGTPTVYIADDDERTFYTWDGHPCAYLHEDHIYGYNGRHLRWFEDGIVWDHDGNRVGYIKDTLKSFASFKPFKAFKNFKSFKSFKEFAPFKPFKSLSDSTIPLREFVLSGK
jgi:hypothetical protein